VNEEALAQWGPLRQKKENKSDVDILLTVHLSVIYFSLFPT